MLFDIDPLDENALAYQIRSLKKLNMQQKMTVRLSEFATEYKNIIGVDFKTDSIK